MKNLNKRIEFITTKDKLSENGLSIGKEKIIFYSCWANAKFLSGKEFIQAYTTNSQIVVSFRVRCCKKVSEIDSLTYKIRFNNKTYNILYINNIDDKFVDLKCEVIN